MTLAELEPRDQVLALARLVSPAVRVEPDRLRAVRLAFLPRSAGSLEADLWFSPLVQARNADGLVLRPDVIALLREELIGDARVPVLRAVHEPFWRALPPLVAIEEEIVWLALVGAEDGVARHLLSVLKTMMADPARAPGLASWAARALGELPSAVRDTPAAIHLDVATCARLQRPIRVEALRAGGSLLALADLLPPDLPTVRVAVERRDDRLLLEIAAPREGARILDAPATDPVILVMTSGGVTDVVTVQPGVRSIARVRGDTVTLRTLRGDEWELARRPTGRVAVTRPVFSWLHLSSLLLSEDHAEDLTPLVLACSRDVEQMEAQIGTIGALFLTGDLTARGASSEFVRVERFLKPLLDGRDIPVFAVPGNHDYDRSSKEHQPFERWWNSHGFGKGVELRHGRIPGDFVATLHTHDARVGIVGLNTTSSHGGTPYGSGPYGAGPYGGSDFAERGAMLDADQIRALVPDLEAWAAAHDLTILLSHHRRQHLRKDAHLDFDRLVAPPGIFDVHLSGGGEWPEQLALGTTFQVRGQSMHAVPAEAVPAGSRKIPPGYWLGRVEQGDTRQARLWSRVWNEESSSFEANPWIRIQFQHRDKSVTVPLAPRPLSRIPRLVAGDILERLGRGSSLLLYGPPGAGKTTLLDDLAHRLSATRRASAAAEDTLDFLRRERDAGAPVIWLVDDIDRVPEARRLALFDVFRPRPGMLAESQICFTASSFETHGAAPGIEPIAVPDADEAELALLFGRRLAAMGAPPDTAREIFAWTGGHVALAARIVEALERDRDLPVARVVERVILAPGADPLLPAPQLGEAALDLYQALLRDEQLPRARDRATAELLASGLAIEAVGETGTDVLRARNRIIRQVYNERWVHRESTARRPSATPRAGRAATPMSDGAMSRDPEEMEPSVMKNPDIREGTEFPATVMFVLIRGIKDCSDGPKVPNALRALNEVLRGLDPGAFLLSTLAGVIAVVPDTVSWSADDVFHALDQAKVGFALRMGVTHGTVEVVMDIDDEPNLIGPPINIAARLATSNDNPGALIHESYAELVDGTLSATHWLHRSVRKAISIRGKPQDPEFTCFQGPHRFDAKPLEREEPYASRPAVLVAYDLPKFSAGDRSQLRKRFTRLAHVFQKLRQSAPMQTAAALLSPGGDGGVLVLKGVNLPDAAAVASRLQTLTEIESLDHDEAIAVEIRIGVHYGPVAHYVNARGIERPTGLSVFVADEIAGDEHARARKGIILTRLLADSLAGGSSQRLDSEFERLPKLTSGPASGVERFVKAGHTQARPDTRAPSPHPSGHQPSPQAAQTRMTRDDLLTRLSRLLPSQFEEVLFRANVPTAHLPGASAPQAARAIDALRHLEQQNQLDQLARILEEVAKVPS